MALSLTRTTLATSSRVFPTGVPVSAVNFAAKSLGGGHDHHGAPGPRHDSIPSWAHKQSGSFQLTRTTTPTTTHLKAARHLSTSSRSLQAPEVPDFSPYMAKNPSGNRSLQYFMVGSMGLLAASGAKSTVHDILSNMSASADVLALAKVEVEMGSIPEGKNLIIKWRGKPVFVRHRTQAEIDEANEVDVKSLRDPETDEQRTQRPEWLVMLGVCTHLGCVPIGEAGDCELRLSCALIIWSIITHLSHYSDGGWFCPCHGSHYDISGRIRRGPAPVSLASIIAVDTVSDPYTLYYSSTSKSQSTPSTMTRRSWSLVKRIEMQKSVGSMNKDR